MQQRMDTAATCVYRSVMKSRKQGKRWDPPEEYMIPCFIGIGRPAEGAVRTKLLAPDMEKQLHWQKL